MTVFDRLESEVQSYARSFPVTFEKAEGAWLTDTDGKRYLDFLAGAGSLNYGHNHPVLQEKLIDYIKSNGITHGLDMHTKAKAAFLNAMERKVLKPRNMDYKIQFTGPTGTNAVEAALKLARRVKGRETVISFTNGFHGVTLGALAITGNEHHRGAAGVSLDNAVAVPFDGYMGDGADTTEYLDRVLGDNSSGIALPAAIIVETVQGEGGLNAADFDWLRKLEQVCRKHDILLIVDDIQAGCGRTGTFFSFEPAGIKPDMVTLSKSLSAYGLPLAVVLIKPEYDVWHPGEHNGTFRGNNHAFVTAAAALDHFWSDDKFASDIRDKADFLGKRLEQIAERYGDGKIYRKGRGLMQGICFESGEVASKVTKECFAHNLVIETSGPEDEVVKCLVPLIISKEDLAHGLDILEMATAKAMDKEIVAPKAAAE
ncbi:MULTISPECIES: diaminobutyrate--2-oxoglutarate transaminase [Thalassospira]|jgi:diaminobutyrate-2-oxoglutarate transaminase|uniref:Diaminobutyrate--2-oxoglutarate transaminase n=1 Tax=Thalassospira xiamenensis TaxID=220697 RepID=A0ABR5Y3P7_9PROT|nr:MULTISPECIES: diaminobutyrate--2-oxoglutarate transaminase [Thalassospira]MAL28674.1 diaminobutyrate--2-oxoglutarate transaminase [Thalassospira sp.]MBR9779369.1 diaminobutyrate--2-oxoglutarate transaminase [Rhodospirillales bacterium]KZD05142.1 diaminobutyrate--2-oxoglutarate transaminase [Thalassospira xiamenensis]KZD11838.1 diaminobutyrate--2-oxoglutarate transaminase [Thalassospira xiamenensis]MBL4841366.1 diaminobutyrate--2-oxoglutarate transaminase [Thalassospira sp.]|tara:strand:- start:394 stop:1677 length:1284 start_codon:yes stop_codon:yes gene_type:complete